MSIGFKSLKKRADFLKLRDNCSSFKTENFIFNFKIDKSVLVPVVGITVSNKIGNAVKRNYIKRLIRSIISNKKSTIPKSLIIEIIAKKNVRPSFSSFNKDIPNSGEVNNIAGTNPINALIKAVMTRDVIISLIFIGAIKRLVKFLLQISSKNNMLEPILVLNKKS